MLFKRKNIKLTGIEEPWGELVERAVLLQIRYLNALLQPF